MLEQMGKQAKDAAFILAQLNTTEKNHALSIIADQLEQQADRILAANQKDIEIAKQNGLSEALIDRLLLTEDRLKGIANDVRHVISLADPVGKIIDIYFIIFCIITTNNSKKKNQNNILHSFTI